MKPSLISGHRALAFAALLSLAACVPLHSKKNAVQVYALNVTIPAYPDWPTATWQLAIAKPIANRVLDSARIVVQPEPGIVQTYRGAVWVDSAPELLQALIVRAFEDSGHIAAAGRLSGGLRSDYLLLLDLRQFEVVYDGNDKPAATVELSAKLVGTTSNRVVASRAFRAAQAARTSDVAAVVRAFETALGDLLPELVGWVLASGEENG